LTEVKETYLPTCRPTQFPWQMSSQHPDRPRVRALCGRQLGAQARGHRAARRGGGGGHIRHQLRPWPALLAV